MARHHKKRRRHHLGSLGDGLLGVSYFWWGAAGLGYLWYQHQHPSATPGQVASAALTSAQQALAKVQGATGPGSVVPAVNAATASTGSSITSVLNSLASSAPSLTPSVG